MIPYTDHECRLVLEELERGEKVIRPSSLEHAEFMLTIAQAYINQHKQDMLEILRK